MSLLFGGKLPWSTASSEGKVKEMKRSCNYMEMATNEGYEEIGEIIRHCRSLAYEAVPDYSRCKQLLLKLANAKISSKKRPKADAVTNSSSVAVEHSVPTINHKKRSFHASNLSESSYESNLKLHSDVLDAVDLSILSEEPIIDLTLKAADIREPKRSTHSSSSSRVTRSSHMPLLLPPDVLPPQKSVDKRRRSIEPPFHVM